MSFATRPAIRVPRTRGEHALAALAWLVLVCWLAYAANVWSSLPERVPTHFDVHGTPNAWGGKSSVLLLPVVGTLLFALNSVLERFPRLYNYPVRVTEQNAATLYRLGRQLLLSVKLIVTCSFAFLFHATVRVARGEARGLEPLFLPALFVPLLVITSILLVKMRRAK